MYTVWLNKLCIARGMFVFIVFIGRRLLPCREFFLLSDEHKTHDARASRDAQHVQYIPSLKNKIIPPMPDAELND